MKRYHNIPGKTYSLFGNSDDTQDYYGKIHKLVNQFLGELQCTEKQLLDYVQFISKSKSYLRRASRQKPDHSKLTAILYRIHSELEEYVQGVELHNQSTPFYKFFTDRRLKASRQQYYIYMIEFELINRIHNKSFREANYKIALLPYCLRETQTNCKARPDAVDFVCQGCIKECNVNEVSQLLSTYHVQPYIWRRANLDSLMRKLAKKHGCIGVLGIACMVELVAGMRRCMRARLPVVGIPLNANRCIRWTGGFYENSVDLKQLESLLNDY